jgi:SAM-dependent methyltransferase
MSAFSAVDSSPDPARLISVLEQTAIGLAAMKRYMAVTHALSKPTAPVLDLGCGAGHDLTVLHECGVFAIGVDPSALMLEAAARRVDAPLARASGDLLPFADDAFAGCWVERVLMHVADPGAVIAEVVRCVRSGGLLTIFEPDWSTLAVNGSRVPVAWISSASHPSVGADVGGLVGTAGCTIVDRVEERSWWTFEEFERNTNLYSSLDRAISTGIARRRDVEAWLQAQRERAAINDFRAELVKILWVATAP